jgi:hypothetical protein
MVAATAVVLRSQRVQGSKSAKKCRLREG